MRCGGGDVLLDPPSFDLNNGSASPGAPSTLVFSGSSLTLAADDYIRLDNFSISTRVADGSGNSTADSGSITFTAGRIELINGSSLDTRANQGKKAGNITLTALGASSKSPTVGPMLMGLSQPIHVLPPGATSRSILNLTTIAAAEANYRER